MLDALRHRVESALSHWTAPLLLAGVALLFVLPAVREPMSTDDLVIRDRLLPPSERLGSHYAGDLVPPESHSFREGVMNLFTWVGPDKKVRARDLIDDGAFVWYASDDFMLDFWRPLSSLTHWLDFRVWPDSMTAQHVQGMVWFALLVASIAVLYRRLPGPAAAAGLGGLLFAIDQNFFFPVAWLSNRNVLIAMLFAVLSFTAHHLWRQTGSRSAGIAATLLLALALLAGEPAVAIFAYFFAYALFLDHGGWTRRASGIAPSLILILAWRLLYRQLDYGALETGLYLDPGRDPFRFIASVVERAPVLLVGQLGWPPAALWEQLSPSGRPIIWTGCILFLLGFGYVLWPLLRRDATVRMWTIGVMIAVLPICASSPVSDRRSWFVALGGMALTGRFVWGVVAGEADLRAGWLRRLAAPVAALGLLVVQLAMPVQAAVSRSLHTPQSRLSPLLGLGDDPAIADQEVVAVTAPSTFLTVYLPWERALYGHPLPRRLRLLAPAFSTLELTRTATDTVTLSAVRGSLMEVEPQPRFDPAAEVYGHVWTNEGFWSGDFPVRAGESRELPGMTVEVLEETPAGLPSSIRVRFDSALEDPARRWVAWDWDARRFRDIEPPALGDSLILPGPFGS